MRNNSLNQRFQLNKVLKNIFGIKEIGLVFILILVCSLLTWRSPVFLSGRNIGVLLSQVSMMAIVAFGMTILLIVGEVDLSVGSQQAFIGVLTMQILNLTSNLWLGILAGLSIGLLIGLINAILVNKLKIVSFVITLAMMFILRGLSYSTTREAVQNFHNIKGFAKIGNGFIWFIPIPVLIMVIVFVIFYLLLSYTTFGRQVYAIGGNTRTAFICGIKVNTIKAICFIITAVLSSLSAIILISRMNSGQNNAGYGFEMQVVAIALLGGCTLEGGSGSLLGTLLAAMLIGVINNGVVLLGIDSSWQMVIIGVVILFSIIDKRVGVFKRSGI